MIRFFKTLYLKWILKDCCHLCKFCRHKKVCPIGAKEMSVEELNMNIEVKKNDKRTRW